MFLHSRKLASELASTFTEAHVDAPVVLQALYLLLHPSFTATLHQRSLLQNLQRRLALLIGQHGVPVLTHEALPHDAITRAALRTQVTHLTRPHTVHKVRRGGGGGGGGQGRGHGDKQIVYGEKEERKRDKVSK